MSRELDLVMAELDEKIEDTVKQLTAECTAELVEATPVDTGWARANWVPKIGPADESVAGERGSFSESDREAGLVGVITSYKLTDGVVTIQNNVPYIGYLAFGTVKRAPLMDVPGALDRAKTAVLGKP